MIEKQNLIPVSVERKKHKSYVDVISHVRTHTDLIQVTLVTEKLLVRPMTLRQWSLPGVARPPGVLCV